MKCVICSSEKAQNLLTLDCGKLDKSLLYQFVKIDVCKNCGHIYNHLFSNEKDNLWKYYDNEYVKTSKNPQLDKFISGHRKEDSNILHLTMGNCWIPLDDDPFDMVVLNHVIEHWVDLRETLQVIKRVLVDGGLLCISTPDASRYKEESFFPFYWFLIKEHIQHFDIEHLELLLESEGFTLMKFEKNIIPIMSEKMLMPNLNALFYLNNGKRYLNLKEKTERYVANQHENSWQKRQMISDLLLSYKPVYVWGIGREFLYIYEMGLKNCNIVGLIDDYPYKQEKFTVDGKKILDNSILKEATANSVLIITATAHSDLIKKKALEIGYKGQIIDV